MILSGLEIKKLISNGRIICNTDPSLLHFGENSVDVTLANRFLLPDPFRGRAYRLGAVPYREYVGYSLTLEQWGFALGSVRESFLIDPSLGLVQMYEGRSTVARSGVFTHLSAGFGDVGFFGAFTLELLNVFPAAVELRVGDRVGQISFMRVEGELGKGYSGIYNASTVRGPKGINGK